MAAFASLHGQLSVKAMLIAAKDAVRTDNAVLCVVRQAALLIMIALVALAAVEFVKSGDVDRNSAILKSVQQVRYVVRVTVLFHVVPLEKWLAVAHVVPKLQRVSLVSAVR